MEHLGKAAQRVIEALQKQISQGADARKSSLAHPLGAGGKPYRPRPHLDIARMGGGGGGECGRGVTLPSARPAAYLGGAGGQPLANGGRCEAVGGGVCLSQPHTGGRRGGGRLRR